MGYSGAQGKLINEKSLKSTIFSLDSLQEAFFVEKDIV
jgi:hypothetical protein